MTFQEETQGPRPVVEYKLSRSFSGRKEVEFNCPGCTSPLICPLTDAGTVQRCPHCQTLFSVPGSNLLDVERKRAAAKARAAAAAREEQFQTRKKRTQQQVATQRVKRATRLYHHALKVEGNLWSLASFFFWIGILVITVAFAICVLAFIGNPIAGGAVLILLAPGLVVFAIFLSLFVALLKAAAQGLEHLRYIRDNTTPSPQES
jgi:uncharacterized Zn finger protein (UPF0148 family)